MSARAERQDRMEMPTRLDLTSRENTRSAQGLKPLDFIPCPVCSLRGHLPGDPDKCRQPVPLGLGGWQPML